MKRCSKSFSSVQWLSHVGLFVTPWIAGRQASLSITISWSSLTLTSIESVMPSSPLILCRPLLLLPLIPPSIKVFSNQSTLPMRWPKYWSFSFSSYQENAELPWWSEQLPLVRATKPMRHNSWRPRALKPVLCSKRSHCNGKPTCTTASRSCTTTGESLGAVPKTNAATNS